MIGLSFSGRAPGRRRWWHRAADSPFQRSRLYTGWLLRTGKLYLLRVAFARPLLSKRRRRSPIFLLFPFWSVRSCRAPRLAVDVVAFVLFCLVWLVRPASTMALLFLLDLQRKQGVCAYFTDGRVALTQYLDRTYVTCFVFYLQVMWFYFGAQVGLTS